jgi:GNAT superfamily N-acetyltransferase
MDFNIRKLESSDRIDGFDCGNASLNEYLRTYALKNQRRMFGVTYAAVSSAEQPFKVIGYFTLANTSIPRQGLPEDMLKGIPKYSGLPAFLLGRLAIDKRFQGKGIGEVLLSRCFEHCLNISKLSGARYLIADAKPSAITWYERYNFQRLEGNQSGDSVKMFVDLAVVASAIDRRTADAPVQ